MPKSDKKRARRKAVAQAIARRANETESSAPLTRAQLGELLDYISEQIVANGHDRSFTYTRAWLAGQGVADGPVVEFFCAHRMACDYDLIHHGDPHLLFGPTGDRLARMPITRAALEALIASLDGDVRENGCDNSLRFARTWLEQQGLPVGPTLTAPLAQGGGCDCEVVLNVEPDNIYP